MIKKFISVVAAITFNSFIGLSYAAADNNENEEVAEAEDNEAEDKDEAAKVFASPEALADYIIAAKK